MTKSVFDIIRKQILKSTMQLIWTNPNGIGSMTSTMGNEDVTVSSIDFDAFFVEFRAVYNDGMRVYACNWTGSAGMYGVVYSFGTSGNPLRLYRRTFYPVAGSKLHFSDCIRLSDASANVTGQDTGCLVPLRIWGIRKRR